jgi:hypothetical protein
MIKWISFQKGVKFTYAYHLMFSRNEIDLNQLSLESVGLIQSQLDETKFRQSGDFDPIINGTIVQKIRILMLILVPLIISWIYMCMEQSKCSRN